MTGLRSLKRFLKNEQVLNAAVLGRMSAYDDQTRTELKARLKQRSRMNARRYLHGLDAADQRYSQCQRYEAAPQ
jgi:hypothetical protein